jgi:hypothetical protein
MSNQIKTDVSRLVSLTGESVRAGRKGDLLLLNAEGGERVEVNQTRKEVFKFGVTPVSAAPTWQAESCAASGQNFTSLKQKEYTHGVC